MVINFEVNWHLEIRPTDRDPRDSDDNARFLSLSRLRSHARRIVRILIIDSADLDG